MKRIIMILCAAVLVVYACRVNFGAAEKPENKGQTITASGAENETISPALNATGVADDVTELAKNPDEEETTITDTVIPLAPEAGEAMAEPEL